MAGPDAKEIMTEGVIGIDSGSSVQEAAIRMRENDIRSLIVQEDGEAVGILVDEDIAYKVAAEGRNPSEVKVKEIMTEDLLTASKHDSVQEISKAMIEHNISRVPVLEGDQVVGIITKTNILRAWPGYIDLLEEKAVSRREGL